ncbi:cysteine desulfurase family protein [Sporosarcina sp. JAI121]|uniref:cysteine desulfurase family protein n=1 Tax=Sporosarcina sp. JAI121 TaxID=2723064 RepID=UPI0015CBAD58|nr:cysteine desulfurase family protein [Sporosarcina sp. JAI121]NYF25188.1 cysteine desulfurase [Sporosarcina sp. JAI121]
MIYFDNSATTIPDDSVLASFVQVNKRFFANPASLHLAGKEAEALLNRSREQILSIVGAPDGVVLFTSGGTEANNLAVIGFARALQSRGKHLITTKIEHPSVLLAMEYLECQGFEVDYLSVDEQGIISIEELKSKLRTDTILVSIMHVNNEIGAVQEISECARIIKEHSRAIFHSDTVQSFGKLPVSLTGEGPDAITISAHKINGLKGSGLLALRKGRTPEAINFGGGQENGLRSGTVSVADAAALAKAMRMGSMDTEQPNFRQWRNRLIEFIKQFKDVLVLAPEKGAPHILSIAFNKINGEVAVNFFQENGITISTSSACSSKSTTVGHVIEAIGVNGKYKNGVIRISFGKNNTEKEIVEFEHVFARFMDLLGRGNK